MNILAVDDEELLLWQLQATIKQVFPEAEIHGVDEIQDALDYVNDLCDRSEQLHYVFLDIKLRGGTGIDLAKDIKQKFPSAIIIFCTAYAEFALEAFQVGGLGYLTKPINKDKMVEALDKLKQVMDLPAEAAAQNSEADDHRLRVQTFGNFEVYVNGLPMEFERSKSKEILAYLIDRRGASVTNAEIAVALWEEDGKTEQIRTYLSSLKKSLRSIGAEDAIIRKRNQTAIDVSWFDCDSYRFLEGDALAINQYRGEYMENYPWAEYSKGIFEK